MSGSQSPLKVASRSSRKDKSEDQRDTDIADIQAAHTFLWTVFAYSEDITKITDIRQKVQISSEVRMYVCLWLLQWVSVYSDPLCLPVCLPACFSAYLPSLSVCLPAILLVFLPVCLPGLNHLLERETKREIERWGTLDVEDRHHETAIL